MKNTPKKLMVAVLASSLCLAGSSYAFGLPSLPGIPGLSGSDSGASHGPVVTDAAIEKFISDGETANVLIFHASYTLALALSAKEQRAHLEQQMEQWKGLETKDKTAAIKQRPEVQSTIDASIKQSMHDAHAQQNLQQLTSAQRDAVLKSLFNLGWGVLFETSQIATGKDMMAAAAKNPMLAMRLLALTDSVKTMGSNLAGTAGYIGQLPGLFKSAGLKVTMPKDASSKPAPVKDIAW